MLVESPIPVPLYIGGLNFPSEKLRSRLAAAFILQRYQGDGETAFARKITARGLKVLYHPGLALEHLLQTSRETPQTLAPKNSAADKGATKAGPSFDETEHNQLR